MHIFIASHKYTTFPIADGYCPLFVGSYRLDSSIPRRSEWSYDDDYLGNISKLNPSFCELTGLHYIWKRCDDDIVGMLHYRRFLGIKGIDGNFEQLSQDVIARELTTHDCIVAERAPALYGGYSITVAEQYRLCHVSTDLIQTRLVLLDLFPDYLAAFDEVMFDTKLSPCNILICQKTLFDNYCSWLFSIERELERRIAVNERAEPYQRRAFGFIAERLLNVYIRKHKLNYIEYPVFDPAESEIRAALDYGLNLPRRPKVNQQALHREAFHPIYMGRSFAAVFDFVFYINHNPDLFEKCSDDPNGAFNHFITHGIEEGRMGSPMFNIQSYVRGNEHLRKRFENHSLLAFVLHYIDYPLDRKHAIGFENISIDTNRSKKSLTSIQNTFERRYRRKMLKKAESCGVID